MSNRAKGFSQEPVYFKSGDFLTCFAQDVKCFSEQLTPWLTLYKDMRTNEVVGVKVSGIEESLKVDCSENLPL